MRSLAGPDDPASVLALRPEQSQRRAVECHGDRAAVVGADAELRRGGSSELLLVVDRDAVEPWNNLSIGDHLERHAVSGNENAQVGNLYRRWLDIDLDILRHRRETGR